MPTPFAQSDSIRSAARPGGSSPGHGSLGFMLELMPQSGADDRMAEVLISLYSTCPPATGIQFHLFASPHIREQLRRYANLRVEDIDSRKAITSSRRFRSPASARPPGSATLIISLKSRIV